MAPDGDLPSGVKQVLKPTDPQTLFAQPPVKGRWPAHVLAMIAPLSQRRSVPRSSRLYAMSGRAVAVEKSITMRPPYILQRCGIRATHPNTAFGGLGEWKTPPPFAEYFPLRRYPENVASNRESPAQRGLIFDVPNPVPKRVLSCQFAPESAKSDHHESSNLRLINKMTRKSPKNPKNSLHNPGRKLTADGSQPLAGSWQPGATAKPELLYPGLHSLVDATIRERQPSRSRVAGYTHSGFALTAVF